LNSLTYFGGTTVDNGTLRIGQTNALPQTTLLTVNSTGSTTGVFDLNGFNQNAVALSSTGTATLVQNSGATPSTLTLNTTGTTSYAGIIQGAVNLTVAGAGTQQLTNAASSYTGLTTLSGTSTLEATTLANGGSPSSIGSASNAASNLVFDGGTLLHMRDNQHRSQLHDQRW